ncbi:MAG TPA: hypothetical protein VKZ65_03315 [Glycomyces sp.]|nr:hypothetical protein [Glycomyces sp.]
MAERPGPEPLGPGGTYLGEFRRGPAVFTVFALRRGERVRVDCDDGNGPGEVCVFADEPDSEPRWHGAWNGDEWCPWIEAEARRIARRLPTRVAAAGRPSSFTASQRLPLGRRARPHVLAPPGPRRGPAGRSIMVEIDRPAPPPPVDPAPRDRFHRPRRTFGLDPDAAGGFRIEA